jgi:DNA adenine methylase
MATPFLKWAGGKGKLVPQIVARTPRFGRYHEPFLGAGAAFFGLEAANRIAAAVLNDSNGLLIETFEVVRDATDSLVEELRQLERDYLALGLPERATYYYQRRASCPPAPVERAAQFIFLNKTCYNGLYRVNRSGAFNVPHGTYANPRVCDEPGLRRCSESLRNAELTTGDFESACAAALPGDFVYLDPPYQPLSATSNFTSYTSEDFSPHEQIRLANAFESMTQRGVAGMLSNSSHTSIEDLYDRHGYQIERVRMSRAINSNGEGRASVPELLITNFERPEVSYFLNSSPK